MIKSTLDFLDFMLLEYWPAICSLAFCGIVYHVSKNGVRFNFTSKKQKEE